MLIWYLNCCKLSTIKNEAAVKGLADGNGQRQKLVGRGGSVSWGFAQTKGKGRECEIIRNVFLHSDVLKFCL